ncbi:hypothetical protein BDQ17DRAFT_1244593, partial [Cyathus striatus]
ELHLYLQSVGEYCNLDDIIKYVTQPDVLERLGQKKTISKDTASQWMKKIGYQWTLQPQGQYTDGHERFDVVYYHDKQFLPAIKVLEAHVRKWGKDGQQEGGVSGCPVVFWFQDESTFYAHDQQKRRWVHKSETAKPYAKGKDTHLWCPNMCLQIMDGCTLQMAVKAQGCFSKQERGMMVILTPREFEPKHKKRWISWRNIIQMRIMS